MKREWPDYRRTASPAPFVRAIANDPGNMARTLSLPGRRRKIFVINQVSSSSRNQKIRRLLIFDNHPDSLRLVFGRGRGLPDVDLFTHRRVGRWELVIVSVLAIAGLVGMFWPLL